LHVSLYEKGSERIIWIRILNSSYHKKHGIYKRVIDRREERQSLRSCSWGKPRPDRKNGWREILKIDKPGKREKKNRKEPKQRNPTILSSLLDFYSYIFAFGLRFLFRLHGVGDI
jgi:hypothetical protein